MGNNHSSAYPGGKQRKNVHWKTAEKPGSPGKPEIIPLRSEDEPNAVTLKWAMPRHDGGAPLLGFQVECNRIGSPAWIHTSPPIINKPELILTGLEGGYRYQFRVSAVNAVSASDPSEISDILTISSDSSALTAPKFITHLEDIVALENETSTIKTTFDGVPPPTIAWFKDGFEIFSSRRTAISTDENSSVLTFHQTLLSDEGEIKCTATNRTGHAVSRARLVIHAPPKLRYPRQYEDGLLYEINETIFLKTSVVGKPTPQVEWWHNGQILTADSRVEITNTPKLSALRIRAAKRNDRGEYQVHARNDIGEDAAAFLVTVTAPPEPPKHLTVTRQIDKSITLTWSPPEDDGGCRVGNYILEYYRTGWDVWLKAMTSRKLSATLFDLIEGSEYRFRVKAESPYGMSEPSQESSAVRIPGESVDSHFLAVESRIISDALRREDGEDYQLQLSIDQSKPPPHVQPRKKKSDVIKQEHTQPKPQLKYSDIVSLSSVDYNRLNKEEPTDADKRISFQLSLEEALSPPPISFSAPELNTRCIPFNPLRNSVSSTELLHEHAIDRFYKAIAMKEELNKRKSVPEPEHKNGVAIELIIPEQSTNENQDNVKMFENNENSSSNGLLQEPSRRWISNSFDDDYTASTVSTDNSEELSHDASVDGDINRLDQVDEEEGTYNPRDKIMRSPSPPIEDRAVEVLSKPAPLPDPNFIPKPILKRREIEISEIPIEPERKPEKTNIFKKITKMPELPKMKRSFPFTKKDKKQELQRKLNEKLEVLNSETNNDENKKETDKQEEIELDEGKIVIEHYGNIVKEYGRQKRPTTPLFNNIEDLRKVAEEQESKDDIISNISKPKLKPNKAKVIVKSKTDKQNQKIKKEPTKEIKPEIPTLKSEKKEKAIKSSQIQSSNKKPDNISSKNLGNAKQQVVLKTAARANIVIPIDYEQLEQQANHSVRSVINYTVDLCLLLLAFWLYFFKDERLAIPILGLLIYRQVQQLVCRNIPDWIDQHTPTWMKLKQS